MRDAIVRGTVSPAKNAGDKTPINQLAQVFQISGGHSVQGVY